jgi:hypothetical protein
MKKKNRFPVLDEMFNRHLEDTFIKGRLAEMQSLLAEGDAFAASKDKPSQPEGYTLRPLPWADNIPSTTAAYPLTASVQYALECIRITAQNDQGDGDKTIINLTGDLLNYNNPSPRGFDKTLHKVQRWAGDKYPIVRTVVRVQLAPDVVRYLYIGENDFYAAVFCADGNSDRRKTNIHAFLVFELEPGEIYCLEPEEFAVLAVTGKSADGKGETGIFTMFVRGDRLNTSNSLLVTEYMLGTPDLSHAELSKAPWVVRKDSEGNTLLPFRPATQNVSVYSDDDDEYTVPSYTGICIEPETESEMSPSEDDDTDDEVESIPGTRDKEAARPKRHSRPRKGNGSTQSFVESDSTEDTNPEHTTSGELETSISADDIAAETVAHDEMEVATNAEAS